GLTGSPARGRVSDRAGSSPAETVRLQSARARNGTGLGAVLRLRSRSSARRRLRRPRRSSRIETLRGTCPAACPGSVPSGACAPGEATHETKVHPTGDPMMGRTRALLCLTAVSLTAALGCGGSGDAPLAPSTTAASSAASAAALSQGEIEFTGRVEAVTPPRLTVSGIAVLTDAQTEIT